MEFTRYSKDNQTITDLDFCNHILLCANITAEKKGVNRQEFVDIARWVAGCEIDPHLVEIVYALLDDDNDGHLSIKEFTPVFFQWRKSRGFQHQSVQIAMGKLTI